MKSLKTTAILTLVSLSAIATGVKPVSAQTYPKSLTGTDTNYKYNHFYNPTAPNCYACHICGDSCNPSDWSRISPDEPFLPHQNDK